MKKSRAFIISMALFTMAGVARGQWSDNFDSYPSNVSIDGMGGWEGWDSATAQSPNTSTARFLSGPNSILVTGSYSNGEPGYSDNVHRFSGYNAGQWRCTANLFIPTDYSGDEYFILLNRYTPSVGPDHWSVELFLSGDSDDITDDFQTGRANNPIVRTGGAVALARGVWSQIQVDFDLTANTATEYYNGTLIATGPWRTDPNSTLHLAAIDLFSESGSGIYFDNLSLVQVPEPATPTLLLAMGAVAVMRRRRWGRRNKPEAVSFRHRISLGFLCLPAIGSLFSFDSGIARADISYPDFSNATSLQMNGDAYQAGNRLRLTDAATDERGSAWFNARQAVQDGFQSTFQFQITGADLEFGGADGFAFVVQNSSATALGGHGGGLGYDQISNSVAVEFDTWQNGVTDPNDNHISVHTRGLLANSLDEAFSLGWTTLIPDLKDGDIHAARIAYVPGNLSVYVDDLATPRLSVAVNLATELDLLNGRAWIGFTSGTGAAFENHDILNWQLVSAPEPASIALLAIGLPLLVRRSSRRSCTVNHLKHA